MSSTSRTPTHLRQVRASMRDDDGSLLLAILLAVVITALITAATITAISAQNKSRDSQQFALGQSLADAAVNDALMTFNLSADSSADFTAVNTPAKARSGLAGAMKWSWYATQALNADVGDGYDLHITTGRADGTGIPREFVVNISAVRTQTNGATLNLAGESVYNIAPGSGFSLGFFADDEFVLNGTSSVTSYNSADTVAPPAAGTGHGMAATNGTLTTGTGTVDAYTLWNYASAPYNDRCTGGACTAATAGNEQPRIGLGGYCAAGTNPANTDPLPANACQAPTKFIDQACAGQTLRPYIASKSGPLPPGTSCWSSLVFDVAPTINGWPGNPSKVYVTGGQGNDANGTATGSVSVLPGVSVNMDNAGVGGPKAFRLLIFTKGDRVTFDAAAAPVKAAWGMWAPNADCAGNSTSGSVTVYGAMACKRITANSGWSLRWDEQAPYVNDDTYPKRAWYVTTFQEK